MNKLLKKDVDPENRWVSGHTQPQWAGVRFDVLHLSKYSHEWACGIGNKKHEVNCMKCGVNLKESVSECGVEKRKVFYPDKLNDADHAYLKNWYGKDYREMFDFS